MIAAVKEENGPANRKKVIDRSRLLGFGERGLDCPDDGNGKASNGK
jgi:hypothetical protein